MAGPVTVACPTCGVAFPVPTEILGVDQDQHHVIVRLDRTELYGHLAECAGKPPVAPPAEPAKTVAKPSDTEVEPMLAPDKPVVAPGRRACTMCGIPNDVCLRRAKRTRLACCAACGVGNSHPTPQEDVDCQVWAAEYGGATVPRGTQD